MGAILMRGSRMGLMAALVAAAGLTSGGGSVYHLAHPPSDLDLGTYRPSRRGKGQNNKRGKGLRSKPKKRPNRLIISKRVRRKHRRAA